MDLQFLFNFCLPPHTDTDAYACNAKSINFRNKVVCDLRRFQANLI